MDYNPINQYNTQSTTNINKLTLSKISNSKLNINSPQNMNSSFDLDDNININNEMEIINENRKINIFNINNDQSKNQNKINEIKNQNNIIDNEKQSEEEKELFSFKRGSLIDNLNVIKTKPLRISGNRKLFVTIRNSALPKNIVGSVFGNKNINNNLRKTLISGNDFNKMKRISISNFNKLNKNKINLNQKNKKNFVRYENMFLDDEYFLKAPSSFPDEDEKNYLLKLKFLEESNYIDEDNIKNNEYIDKLLLRQTNSISFNSNLDKNLCSKYLSKKSIGISNFDKIEEEEDYKEGSEMNMNKINDRITILNNETKDDYVDEEEISGKNILYAKNVKAYNNFEEGTFNKSLVSFENESKIVYISINLFIKKIALFNFRINYPILYKAFLQQYNIFLSISLFCVKIMQAFELYYDKYNKISNELIDLLNKVISANYEKIIEDLILLEKIQKFYLFIKEFIFSGNDSGLEKDIENIYYILFECDSEEDLDFSRKFVLERRKSNSIFMRSKIIYSNIFNKMKNDKSDKDNKNSNSYFIKTSKKKKILTRMKTDTAFTYRYFYIFNHEVMEIAEYLTCISYQMMRNINQNELLNKNFTSKEKLIKAPNVMKLIDRFNKLILFIIEDIFSYDDKKTRSQVLVKWIEVAIKLKDIHNYNDLVMINTCFVNCTLNKLKLTFKKLSTKYKNIIKEMNSFCSSKECYLNIRKLIFNCKGIPYIPYLGIILKEIINIEEMKYIVEDKNINFGKLVKLYNVINKFNEFKKSKFSFEKSKELDILMNLKPKTEEELDEMVSQIEPKLKIFARGNKKRLTNTDKFYYDKKINDKSSKKK